MTVAGLCADLQASVTLSYSTSPSSPNPLQPTRSSPSSSLPVLR